MLKAREARKGPRVLMDAAVICGVDGLGTYLEHGGLIGWHSYHVDQRPDCGPLVFVYFAQANGTRGPIKIGKSINPVRRIRSFITEMPYRTKLLAVIPDEVVSESALHRTLRRHRMRGEWFRPRLEILGVVEAALQLGGSPENLNTIFAR